MSSLQDPPGRGSFTVKTSVNPAHTKFPLFGVYLEQSSVSRSHLCSLFYSSKRASAMDGNSVPMLEITSSRPRLATYPCPRLEKPGRRLAESSTLLYPQQLSEPPKISLHHVRCS